MRKKELMKFVLPELSKSQIRTAKNDRYIKREFEYGWALWGSGTTKTYTETSYGTRMYYAARAEAGILIVSAWTRSRAAKQETPDYICYIEAENAKWTTCADGKWSGSMLDTIENKIYITNTNHRAKDIDDQESLDLCRRVLGVEDRADITGTVLKWQEEQKKKANRERAQRKQEYCDARMAMIPEIPEGFAEWADREGTQEDHFIFYRGRKKAYCTRCGAHFVPDIKLTHSPGNPGAWNYKSKACICYCPECRAKLTAKSWDAQKMLLTYGSVVLVQQVGGEVVFRHFVVRKLFHHADDPLDTLAGEDGWEHSVNLEEGMRVFADPETFRGKESYWLGEVNNRSFAGWKRTRRRVLHGIKETLEARDMPAGRAYIEDPDGLAKLSGIRRCIIDRCTHFDNTYNVQLMLIRVAGKRYLEYLFRSGLKRLANQIISGRHTNDLNEDAKDLKTLLGLDGVQLERLKAMDGDTDTLRVIRQAGAMGEKIDDETLQMLSRNGIDLETLLLKETGMSLQKMANYLRKQATARGKSLKDTSVIYRDYIDAARKLGIDTTDDIVRRPRNLEEMHDRYVEEVKEREGAQRDASVDGKFPHISKNAKENTKHFGYKKEGLVIIVPKAASDITKEGRKQHHCVGASDNYIGKMDRGETYILFLRQEDDQGTPYYTLEAKYDGKIIQARSKFNRQPDWEKISTFLDSFTREIGKRAERERKKAQRQERRTETERQQS